MKTKRSVCFLISAILTTLYMVLMIFYFTSLYAASDSEIYTAGLMIGTTLVMPHLVVTGVALVLNWIGWALNQRWAALTCGILYAVSIVLMFTYFWGIIVQMVLCFVAFALMKKKALPAVPAA